MHSGRRAAPQEGAGAPDRLSRTARVVLLLLLCCLPMKSRADTDFSPVRKHLGARDGALVTDPEGRILFQHRLETMRIPASSLKVLTALAALACLGSDYRFPTEFYLSRERDLVIKGYGDPLLVSETVAAIAGTLESRLGRVRHILVDDSYFSSGIRIPGVTAGTPQPYNAPPGALCVNFNTVSFRMKNGRMVSAEPQTPLLARARERIRRQDLPAGRLLISDRKEENLLYAGELFAYFLDREGVPVTGRIRPGRLHPDASRLIYRHRSGAALSEMTAKLLRYSNNFMANQILLALGAEVYGPPATLAKGVRAVTAYCRRSFSEDGIRFVEGSGISRKNRVSPKLFGEILDAFLPYHKRMPKDGRIYSKTGTLEGIRTRVGYMESENGLFRFVILLNTPGRETGPVLSAISARIP